MGISQHTHGTDNARCLIALCLLDRQRRPAGHRAAPAARPEQRAGRVRRRADPDDVPGLSAGGGRGEPQEVRGRLGRAARPEAGPHGRRDHARGARRATSGACSCSARTRSSPTRTSTRSARRSSSLEFLAVQDIFLTETAEFADVVLPASSFFEKNGTYTNTDRRVQIGRPAIATARRGPARLAGDLRDSRPPRLPDELRVAGRSVRRVRVADARATRG